MPGRSQNTPGNFPTGAGAPERTPAHVLRRRRLLERALRREAGRWAAEA